MFRGIYASACALVEQMARVDLLAANLANASTPGYRRLVTAPESFPELISAGSSPSPGTLRLGVTAAPPIVDLSSGPIEKTDNPLDLAIAGDGFFVISHPSGTRLYTRAGRFLLDATGRLVTPDGYPVLSDRGEVRLPPGRISVAEDGTIAVDNKPIAKLLIVSFPPTASLSPAGHTYYTTTSAPQSTSQARVLQGAIEHSNVNPARELGQMMVALRVYEASVRAMSLQDSSFARLLQAVA